MHYVSNYKSPLGNIILIANEQGLTKARFSEPLPQTKKQNDTLARAKKWLHAYFAKSYSKTLPSLHPSGTPFQKQVWQALQAIQPGTVSTYGTIASDLQTSPRAIGNALAQNPLLLFIPCHRIIAANRKLGDYAAGTNKKMWLLTHEGCMLA